MEETQKIDARLTVRGAGRPTPKIQLLTLIAIFLVGSCRIAIAACQPEPLNLSALHQHGELIESYHTRSLMCMLSMQDQGVDGLISPLCENWWELYSKPEIPCVVGLLVAMSSVYEDQDTIAYLPYREQRYLKLGRETRHFVATIEEIAGIEEIAVIEEVAGGI